MSLIDPRLAEILVCPADHGELSQNEAASTLTCQKCGRVFPVEGGIPVMLLTADQETVDD
ncbi:MAG: Trm112 family protein [Acidimicrobiia bacterium]